MPLSRFFLPLLFAFSLLLAQQGGVVHTLRHTLAEHQQQDKQAPHSTSCEQCATYAQLGSALNSASHSFAAITLSAASVRQHTFAFRSIHVVAAPARGPPDSLHLSA